MRHPVQPEANDSETRLLPIASRYESSKRASLAEVRRVGVVVRSEDSSGSIRRQTVSIQKGIHLDSGT